jgi:hypothetical protein
MEKLSGNRKLRLNALLGKRNSIPICSYKEKTKLDSKYELDTLKTFVPVQHGAWLPLCSDIYCNVNSIN